jgi:hypothetical protein
LQSASHLASDRRRPNKMTFPRSTLAAAGGWRQGDAHCGLFADSPTIENTMNKNAVATAGIGALGLVPAPKVTQLWPGIFVINDWRTTRRWRGSRPAMSLSGDAAIEGPSAGRGPAATAPTPRRRLKRFYGHHRPSGECRSKRCQEDQSLTGGAPTATLGEAHAGTF